LSFFQPTKEKSVKVEDSSSTKQDSTSSVTVTQKTKPVEKSLDPWSQAIATFGMPKIPKKKKQVVGYIDTGASIL